MKQQNRTLRQLVLSAMFAALCWAATMLVQIPTVAGYTNIGEGMCLLAGLVLGPWYGFVAAGIGSGLADLLAGYAHYVPGTFIIKGLMALAFARLYHTRGAKREGDLSFGWFLGAVVAEAIMVVGYYLYEAIFMGEGFAGALLGVSGNAMQGIVGAVCACLLTKAIGQTGIYQKFGYAAIKKRG